MIIDFHTHAFPDAIAKRAVDGLRQGVIDADMGFPDELYGDGTASALISMIKESGADKAVLLPVATKSGQDRGINSWSVGLDSEYIFPFAACYPDENAVAYVNEIAEKGFKGIKLHGDFQNFHADDERMLELYRECGRLGLIVVHHAGLDCCSVNDIHVTPERMANVLDKVDVTRFVLAHMGGVMCEERAVRLLAGADNIWYDTAYCAGRLPPDVMTDLIRAYGADRVLFGSDCPWNHPRDDIALIRSCGISEEEKAMILGGNAARLTGLAE